MSTAFSGGPYYLSMLPASPAVLLSRPSRNSRPATTNQRRKRQGRYYQSLNSPFIIKDSGLASAPPTAAAPIFNTGACYPPPSAAPLSQETAALISQETAA